MKKVFRRILSFRMIVLRLALMTQRDRDRERERGRERGRHTEREREGESEREIKAKRIVIGCLSIDHSTKNNVSIQFQRSTSPELLSF